MLVEFPVLFTTVLRQLIVVLDITLLVTIMVACKLVDASWLDGFKRHIRDFYPMLFVLCIILTLAVFKK